MNNETQQKLIKKHMLQGLDKGKIRKIPYLDKDHIPQADFLFNWEVVKEGLAYEKQKTKEKKEKKILKSIKLKLSPELIDKLENYADLILISRKRLPTVVSNLIESAIDDKIMEKRRERYGY